MKTLQIALAVLFLMSLSGCATSLKTEVSRTVSQMNTVASICSSDDVRSFSSPTSIADSLKQAGLVYLGLTSSGDAVEGKRTDFSQIVADFLGHSNDLTDQERDKVGDVSRAMTAVSKDAAAIRASFETAYGSWQTSLDTKCHADTYACRVDSLMLMSNLATAIQGDTTSLAVDALHLKGVTKVALATLPKSTALDQIAQDVDNVTVLVQQVQVIIRFATEPGANGVSAKIKSDLDNLNAAAEKKYVAYFTSTLAMNELQRVARSAEIKLDEIDKKTWFIVSAFSLMVSPYYSQGIQEELQRAIPPVATGDQDSVSMRLAFMAASCKQLSRDAASDDANASRTQLLMYPVYLGVICGLNPNTKDACMKMDDQSVAVEEKAKAFASLNAEIAKLKGKIVSSADSQEAAITKIRDRVHAMFNVLQQSTQIPLQTEQRSERTRIDRSEVQNGFKNQDTLAQTLRTTLQ